MLTFTGVSLAAVLAFGATCVALQGVPRRFPPELQGVANAQTDRAFINELTVDRIRAGGLIPLGASGSGAHPAVLVWGDSHAMAALPAIDALLTERNAAGRAATHSATVPVLVWYVATPFGLGKDALAFNDAVFDYVRREQIPDVILIACWPCYTKGDDEATHGLAAAAARTVRRLAQAGVRPWILLDVPAHPFNVPRALSLPMIAGAPIASLRARPEPDRAFDVFDAATVREIEAAGGRFIDPKPRFLDPSDGRYIIERDGVALYLDKEHLTASGAKLMLLPLFRESLRYLLHDASTNSEVQPLQQAKRRDGPR